MVVIVADAGVFGELAIGACFQVHVKTFVDRGGSWRGSEANNGRKVVAGGKRLLGNQRVPLPDEAQLGGR